MLAVRDHWAMGTRARGRGRYGQTEVSSSQRVVCSLPKLNSAQSAISTSHPIHTSITPHMSFAKHSVYPPNPQAIRSVTNQLENNRPKSHPPINLLDPSSHKRSSNQAQRQFFRGQARLHQ